MKNRILVFFGMAFLILSCSKEEGLNIEGEPLERQADSLKTVAEDVLDGSKDRLLMVHLTTTFDYLAGRHGIPLQRRLVRDFDNGLHWSLHGLGGEASRLKSEASSKFFVRWSSSRNMSYVIGNRRITITGSSVARWENDTYETSREESSQFFPPFQIASKAQVNENMIIVQTFVKRKDMARQQPAKDFYVSSYAVEDQVSAYQYTDLYDSTLMKHRFVLRATSLDGIWGKILSNGDLGGDSIFMIEARIPIEKKWNINNTEVHTLLWEGTGSMAKYINGTKAYLED